MIPLYRCKYLDIKENEWANEEIWRSLPRMMLSGSLDGGPPELSTSAAIRKFRVVSDHPTELSCSPQIRTTPVQQKIKG